VNALDVRQTLHCQASFAGALQHKTHQIMIDLFIETGFDGDLFLQAAATEKR
jgi:hypothetical protein